ncbi:hypothetical protein [Paenibacillus sp. FSL R7-0331]|uniref:hypothetical protein n=1 Tax=Paenibacillus sp. FSL R7-0331 TaxID=1536773 RepID=UPI0004F7FDBE|nr:hypothetical protein [Paenibacillus sp. FSL R7-0331]AIQ52140.1 hypothetical protein R70331_11895 [Paenibacillus sp. FSL R7-0331]
MDTEIYSTATLSDLEEMSRLHIPFMKELPAELEAWHSRLIRWEVLKNNGLIMGCHRTVLLSGWGFLYGVYVRPENHNIWSCYQLVQHTVDSLSGCVTDGFITWIDDMPSWKSVMMKRLKFSSSVRPVYRLFFKDTGLQRLRQAEIKDSWLQWRYAVPEDSTAIESLAEAQSSFIDSVNLSGDFTNPESGWFVGEDELGIAAGIRWCIYGDTLFAMFTLSSRPELDITAAIVQLLAVLNRDGLTTYRINLEHQRKITLLRLSGFSPYTNECGHETHYLFKSVKGNVLCETIR